jgi:hypothetical protein
MNFKKTKLAAAVGTAALAMGLSAPANAVVLGGDGGWEVSYTGTINLFYNYWDRDFTAGGVQTFTESSSHLNEGLLPAFFTFKAKSPTVNGLTGTSQISFAPDSSAPKATRQDKGGVDIDMREVFFNVDGSFGTISAGRTLGLYQRQAILKDQTLFGVGAAGGIDGGGTTLGRIGFGYIYPEFRTRFAYKTPTINGFNLEVGVFDPQENTAGGNLFETDTPQFQAEANYNTTFTDGTFGVWVGGIWQEDEPNTLVTTGDDDITHAGWNVGADLAFHGFNILGSYYAGEGLGVDLKWLGSPVSGGTAGIGGAAGYFCAATGCEEADNDGFYVQGSYTFGGKTKVAVSYGESNQDEDTFAVPAAVFNEVQHDMWTVGIYHDITPWLKVVAEYNNQDQEAETPAGAPVNGIETDGFSVGGFIFW